MTLMIKVIVFCLLNQMCPYMVYFFGLVFVVIKLLTDFYMMK